MQGTVDILEGRVVAATELIVSLRTRVKSLERELMTNHAMALCLPPDPQPSTPDSALVEELERLRTERVVVRESIRELLKEIDRVSW